MPNPEATEGTKKTVPEAEQVLKAALTNDEGALNRFRQDFFSLPENDKQEFVNKAPFIN